MMYDAQNVDWWYEESARVVKFTFGIGARGIATRLWKAWIFFEAVTSWKPGPWSGNLSSKKVATGLVVGPKFIAAIPYPVTTQIRKAGPKHTLKPTVPSSFTMAVNAFGARFCHCRRESEEASWSLTQTT